MAGQLSKTPGAEKTRRLLSLVNGLRALGAGAELNLPRIAVIGNQSAGKSSVVEAISGISVPRDAGTCTRCPMECRLSSSTSPWSCRVSLRYEWDSAGKRLNDVKEVVFGPIMTQLPDIELRLRQAQAAILNPHNRFDTYLALDASTLAAKNDPKQLKFSQNTVCVDITGPNEPELSFIDLPGLIQNADTSTINLVETMVTEHIKGNTLILVTMPATDDIENQQAMRLAKTEDPQGRRTIGVLTKPDMVPAGNEQLLDNWLRIMEAKAHRLTHGYYCTKQPNDKERAQGIKSETARERERTFFEETAPWKTSSAKVRLGTPNLVGTLSHLLMQLIREALPSIQAEAAVRLTATRKELAGLPIAVTGEPATYVLQRVTNFSTSFGRLTEGSPEASQLIQGHRSVYRRFKRAIRRTAPDFKPYPEESHASTRWDNGDQDEDDSDSDEVTSADLADINLAKPFYLNDMRAFIERCITRELPGNTPFAAKKRLIVDFQSSWAELAQRCFEDARSKTADILFEELERAFGRFDLLHSELLTFLNEVLNQHERNCKERISDVLECQKMPFTQNDHYLQTCKDKWLARYKDARAGKANGMLNQPEGAPPAKKQKGVTIGHPPEGTDTTSSRSSVTPLPFSFGLTAPGTGSASTTSSVPNFFGAPASTTTSPPAPAAKVTQAAQFGAPKDDERAQLIQNAIVALAAAGYSGLVAEDLGRLNPSDPYETELEVMAEVRGFFQVAYKRVIDDVPMNIDLKFLRAFSGDLQRALIEHLGLGTENANARCAEWLREDNTVVVTREELLGREKRLVEATKQLYAFGV